MRVISFDRKMMLMLTASLNCFTSDEVTLRWFFGGIDPKNSAAGCKCIAFGIPRKIIEGGTLFLLRARCNFGLQNVWAFLCGNSDPAKESPRSQSTLTASVTTSMSDSIFPESMARTQRPTWYPKLTGTALPICLYWLHMLPENAQSSGKV